MTCLRSIAALLGTAALIAPTAGATASEPAPWFLAAVAAPQDLAVPVRHQPTVIAIVDDGVQLDHADLQPFLWTNTREIPDNRIDDDGNGYVDDVHGWDAADRDANPAPPQRPEFYHGTHIASVIAAIARRAYGAAAPDYVRLLPVKALADSSPSTNLQAAYPAIEYASKVGADIILTAWAVAHVSTENGARLQAAADAGAMLIASAGNFPEERPQYPAAHAAVLAVAASDRNGGKSQSSNFGQFIDLSAPGIDIPGIDALDPTTPAVRSGTSFSAAIVAAAAAIVRTQNPAFSATDVRACLLGSATSQAALPRYAGKLGAGLLNIGAAAECALLATDSVASTTLTNPRGYLRLKQRSRKPSTWQIAPEGRFNGVRFRLAQQRAGEPTGELRFATAAPASNVVATTSLEEFPADVFVPGSAAQVTYQPARRGRNQDVLIEYAVDSIDFSREFCRDTEYVATPGTLTDGSGAADYAFNTSCKWQITAPEGMRVQFEFDDFDTEARTDLLYFFNGEGTHEDVMAIFSGPGIPPALTSWGNRVLVWFVANGTEQRAGWTMRYRFVPVE